VLVISFELSAIKYLIKNKCIDIGKRIVKNIHKLKFISLTAYQNPVEYKIDNNVDILIN
tara:strand:- start:392 stop:568 length:177 start_codon:yes stop_codon:yes gene_type:complete